MADFNEMDGLELPSLDSLGDEVDTRFTGEAADNGGSEPEVGDASYDPDDITMPVFSEMGGESAPVTPSAPAPASPGANKTVSLAKPMFEEMMPDNPKPVSKPMQNNSFSQTNTGSQGGYQSTSSGYQSTSGGFQNTSGSYSAPSYTYTSTTGNTSSNTYWDNLAASSELAESGRKKAKVLGIIIIVLSVLDILGGGIRGLGGSGLRIYGAWQFMKNASSGWRIYLCVVCVISMIMGIYSISIVDSELLPLAAQYDLTWIVSIVQFIYVMYTIGMGVMSYFFIFDKSIKEYCRMP